MKMKEAIQNITAYLITFSAECRAITIDYVTKYPKYKYILLLSILNKRNIKTKTISLPHYIPHLNMITSMFNYKSSIIIVEAKLIISFDFYKIFHD
jgi:hypothetical protein